jgi:YgiT-type zinc finger domain-containing protein
MIAVYASVEHGICALCGGRLDAGTTSLPFATEARTLVVKGVPALVCGDCEEAYLDGPILDEVLALVRQQDTLHAEVSVVRFRAA